MKYSKDLKDIALLYRDELAKLENCGSFDEVKSKASKELAEQLKPLYDNGYRIRFDDSGVYAAINWPVITDALSTREGSDVGMYITISKQEDEAPFVVDGSMALTPDELAKRYLNARKYVGAYPLRDDWHFNIEQYMDAYLSSLLILNGRLFSGDSFTVPQELRATFDGLIAKYADDDLGKLLSRYKSLLESNGWKLAAPVRDFLALHGVPGYGRQQ